MRWKYRRLLATFQSTLPARGATKSRKEHGMAQEFQSTLPARGATRWFGRSPKQNSISIHAPRTGSDSYSNFAYARCKNFNPRSPHGERRFRPEPVAPTQDISIHAPRTAQWRQASRNFNPRSPHGERRSGKSAHLPCCGISIHAPRTGSDVCAGTASSSPGSFQSTLPARGATRAKL